jgi:hypothetical protein
MADSAGNATQTSVTTLAMISFFSGSFHGLDEVFIVPGIDLPRTSDVGRFRKQLLEFWHKWSIGATFKAGRQNRRQLEILRGIGQRQHVVLELIG